MQVTHNGIYISIVSDSTSNSLEARRGCCTSFRADLPVMSTYCTQEVFKPLNATELTSLTTSNNGIATENVTAPIQIETSPGVLSPAFLSFVSSFPTQNLRTGYENGKVYLRFDNYTNAVSAVFGSPGGPTTVFFVPCTEPVTEPFLVTPEDIRIFPSFFGETKLEGVYEFTLGTDKGCLFIGTDDLACKAANSGDLNDVLVYRALEYGSNCSECYCKGLCLLWEKLNKKDGCC